MSTQDLRLQVILQAIDQASGPLKAISGNSSKMGAVLKAARDELSNLMRASGKIDEFQKGAQAIQANTKATEAARAKMRDLQAQILAAQHPHRKLTDEYKAQRREVLTLERAGVRLNSNQADLTRQLTAAGVPVSQLASRQAQLRQRMEQVNATIREQSTRMERLKNIQKQYQQTMALRDKAMSFGTGALAAGGGTLYGAWRLIQPGIEFDKTMGKVQALARLDKDSEQMQALRQQARHLGAVTMFSATDAAQGQAFLAMAGFTPEAIRAAMPGLLDMALAGDVELGRTADIASNILSAFKIDPAQMGYVSDVLTKAFTTSNVSLESLGETMKYVGPIAQKAGMSLEEAAAMAGLLGNIGLQGSDAGTRLQAMLTRLSGPTKQASKALKTLGVRVMDAKGNMRNMPTILKEIAEAMSAKKLGSAKQLAILKDVFGERPAAGLAELIDQSGTDGLAKYLDIVSEHSGAAAKTAGTMADNLPGDLDELSSAFDELRITLFDTNEGALRDTVQWLTKLVGRVGAWAAENPGLVSTLSKIAAATAVVVTALGSLALALAAVMGPFAVARYGLGMIRILAAPAAGALWTLAKGALPAVAAGLRVVLGLLIANPIGAVIAVLAGAALLIYTYWAPIREFFAGFFAGLSTAMQPFMDTLRATFAAVAPIFQPIAALLADLWAWFMRLIAPVEAADGAARSLGQSFGSALGGVLGFLLEIPLKLISLPLEFFRLGSELIAGLVRGITGALGSVKDAITGAGGAVVGWFKEKLGIRSPSRVFAALGGFTMQGLAQGLQRSAGAPLDAMNRAMRTFAVAAGTGMAGVAMAAGAGIQFDTRPPLAAGAMGAGAVSNQYEIHIHAAAGMDPEQIARAVAAELDRRDRANAARRRSRLADDE